MRIKTIYIILYFFILCPVLVFAYPSSYKLSQIELDEVDVKYKKNSMIDSNVTISLYLRKKEVKKEPELKKLEKRNPHKPGTALHQRWELWNKVKKKQRYEEKSGNWHNRDLFKKGLMCHFKSLSDLKAFLSLAREMSAIKDAKIVSNSFGDSRLCNLESGQSLDGYMWK